jgi:hypothetical protein
MVTPDIAADAPKARRLAARLDSMSIPPFFKLQGRFLLGGVLARAGLIDGAKGVMQSARDSVTSKIDPEQELLAVEAYVRTLTGEPDLAIDLLKRAVAANPDHDFATVANRTWWWQDLRTHPRFKEITGGR